VYLQFIDTGCGISGEDLSKVFQAYHSTKKGGHGLGMMIVQRIMRDHGGQIGIESSQGTGTVITLQFPQKHRRTRLLEGQ
jgi:signal transduction histidine kinase